MLAREVNRAVEKRVDPRVKRTRKLIVGAFNKLVVEKGHTGLTVQEIAERATINRATFYAHFTDQYELLDYYISESFREELRLRLPDSPGLSKENLKALVLAACEFLSKLETNCRRSDRQFRPLIEARVQGELYELLLGWIGASPEGTGGWSVGPEVVASVVSWSIFGAALDWSRNGTAPSPEEDADQLLSVVVEGLQF